MDLEPADSCAEASARFPSAAPERAPLGALSEQRGESRRLVSGVQPPASLLIGCSVQLHGLG